MKDGKLPLSKKKAYVTPEEIFGGGSLTLDSEIAEYFKAKGWQHKWLSIPKLKAKGGRHSSGYQVFMMPESLKTNRPANIFGTNPDGTIVVGDLVLGYKEISSTSNPVTVENHKRYLADKIKALSKDTFQPGKDYEIKVDKT